MSILQIVKGWSTETISSVFPFFIGSVNIEDLTNEKLLGVLEVKNFIIDIVRCLFLGIIFFCGAIIDFVWETMKQIMSFSVMDIIEVADISLNITEIAWIILSCVIGVTLLLKMFSWKGDYSFITNIFVVIFAIGIFTSFCAICNDLQDDGVQLIDEIILGNEDVSLSESILRNSTYDLLASVEQDNMVNISDGMDLDFFDYNTALKKGELQGIYDYNVDGSKIYRDLSDGIWNSGVGEERYYRYYIDFISVIFITLIVALTYVLGIFKTAYLKINKFFIELTGTLVIATSISKLDKVKMVFSEILKLTCSILWSYGVMLLCTIFVKSVVFTEDLNWLAKCFYLIAFMLVSLVGVDIVNKSYGLEDATGAVMKGMFVGKRVKGMVKGAYGMGRDAVGKVADGISGLSEQAGKGVGNVMDNYDNYTDGIKANNDFMKQAYDNPNMGIDSKNVELLGNKDPNIMYGGEGIKPSHSVKTWNDERGQKVDDRKERYDANVSNNDSDGKLMSRNYDDVKTGKLSDEKAPQMEMLKKSLMLMNALNNNDTYNDKYGNAVPNGFTLKSYKEYDKDFHEKGDESVYKKSQQVDSGGTKTLPVWYNNQDLATNKNSNEKVDREALTKRMHALGKSTESKELSHQEILKNVDSSKDINDNDKKFLHNLHPKELPSEYNKIMKNITTNVTNEKHVKQSDQSYDTFLLMNGKDGENNE